VFATVGASNWAFFFVLLEADDVVADVVHCQADADKFADLDAADLDAADLDAADRDAVDADAAEALVASALAHTAAHSADVDDAAPTTVASVANARAAQGPVGWGSNRDLCIHLQVQGSEEGHLRKPAQAPEQGSKPGSNLDHTHDPEDDLDLALHLPLN
jgi:hypothetical protein